MSALHSYICVLSAVALRSASVETKMLPLAFSFLIIKLLTIKRWKFKMQLQTLKYLLLHFTQLNHYKLNASIATS